VTTTHDVADVERRHRIVVGDDVLHGKDFRTGLYQLRRRDARSRSDVECAQMTTVNQPRSREPG
jgi:hypothetical protein